MTRIVSYKIFTLNLISTTKHVGKVEILMEKKILEKKKIDGDLIQNSLTNRGTNLAQKIEKASKKIFLEIEKKRGGY